MFQINGWAIIRESFNEEGESRVWLKSIIEKIEVKISQMDNINEFCSLRILNGEYHLSITVNHNHRTENAIDFFKYIATIALGAYGLLYILDDEDIDRGNGNKFKVLRLRKGIVDELEDPFLSPVNPEVEE